MTTLEVKVLTLKKSIAKQIPVRHPAFETQQVSKCHGSIARDVFERGTPMYFLFEQAGDYYLVQQDYCYYNEQQVPRIYLT